MTEAFQAERNDFVDSIARWRSLNRSRWPRPIACGLCRRWSAGLSPGRSSFPGRNSRIMSPRRRSHAAGSVFERRRRLRYQTRLLSAGRGVHRGSAGGRRHVATDFPSERGPPHNGLGTLGHPLGRDCKLSDNKMALRFMTDSYTRAQDSSAPSWKWALWGRRRSWSSTADGSRQVEYDFVENMIAPRRLVRLDATGKERAVRRPREWTPQARRSRSVDPGELSIVSS